MRLLRGVRKDAREAALAAQNRAALFREGSPPQTIVSDDLNAVAAGCEWPHKAVMVRLDRSRAINARILERLGPTELQVLPVAISANGATVIIESFAGEGEPFEGSSEPVDVYRSSGLTPIAGLKSAEALSLNGRNPVAETSEGAQQLIDLSTGRRSSLPSITCPEGGSERSSWAVSNSGQFVYSVPEECESRLRTGQLDRINVRLAHGHSSSGIVPAAGKCN